MNISQFKPVMPDLQNTKSQNNISSGLRMNTFQNQKTWNIKQFAPVQPPVQQPVQTPSEDGSMTGFLGSDNPNSFRNILGSNLAKAFLDPIVTFGKSALAVPGDIGASLQGKPINDAPFKLPSGGTGTTYQSKAGAVTSDVISGKTSPLAGTASLVAPVVGGAAAVLGAGDATGAQGLLSGGAETGALDTGESLTQEAAQKGSTVAKKALIGKEGLNTLEKLNNPEARAFIPEAQGGSGKTFGDVVSSVNDAVDKFTTDSKSALQKVKDSLPSDVDVKGGKAEVGTRVNQAIVDSVNGSAKYKGIAGGEDLFKTPQDLVDRGILNPDEAKKVTGMVKSIDSWKDFSPRGVLNLKEKLGAFFSDGSNGSNAILRGIQNNLKDLVSENAPTSAIKKALATASQNINDAEDFARNLTGNTDVQGESKLSSIARNLRNPAAGDAKLSIIQKLEKATGAKITPQLKGYADYLNLLNKAGGDVSEIPSRTGTILKSAGKRIAAAGGAVAAGLGIKSLFQRNE